jgi:GNAT superfamily N-acetyltransferase
VGTARYYVNLTTNYAELAMAVRDDWQGKGMGSLLFRQLVVAAKAAKLRGIEAYVQPDNARMMKLLHESGLDAESHQEEGLVRVTITFGKQAPSSGREPREAALSRPQGKSSP